MDSRFRCSEPPREITVQRRGTASCSLGDTVEVPMAGLGVVICHIRIVDHTSTAQREPGVAPLDRPEPPPDAVGPVRLGTEPGTALHCAALHCTVPGGMVDPRPRIWTIWKLLGTITDWPAGSAWVAFGGMRAPLILVGGTGRRCAACSVVGAARHVHGGKDYRAHPHDRRRRS